MLQGKTHNRFPTSNFCLHVTACRRFIPDCCPTFAEERSHPNLCISCCDMGSVRCPRSGNCRLLALSRYEGFSCFELKLISEFVEIILDNFSSWPHWTHMPAANPKFCSHHRVPPRPPNLKIFHFTRHRSCKLSDFIQCFGFEKLPLASRVYIFARTTNLRPQQGCPSTCWETRAFSSPTHVRFVFQW